MSPEKDDERSAREIQDEMEDEAGRMQQRLDEIGEQAQDADKKADIPREHSEPDKGGEPLGAVGGDAADEGGADEDSDGADEDSDDADDDSDDADDDSNAEDDDSDAEDDDSDAEDDDDRS